MRCSQRYPFFVAYLRQAPSPSAFEHDRDAFRAFLHSLYRTAEIAVEATATGTGSIDEMEEAEHRPHFANPHESKKLMGKPNKHDALLMRWPRHPVSTKGHSPKPGFLPVKCCHVRVVLKMRMNLRVINAPPSNIAFTCASYCYGLHNDSIKYQ